ncbi:INO80 complex subunit B-like [Dendronephthya gigantea]|uniref:INO80 complex subunit B-like n=1 Tax=Dendronephthya gigantea TaxID=151771 RepID=UPI00106A4D39|nr:INO80 complex subunit B-like [Dendronephthya gigantea]
MGRKNQITSDDDLRVVETTEGSSSPKKKHKHKHKKHKRKRDVTESESVGEIESPKKKKRKKKEREKDEGRSSLKLKIKLGGRTLTTKEVPTISPVTEISGSKAAKQSSKPEQLTTAWVDEPWQAEDDSCDVQDLKNTEDQEEEDWLDALEAGELDDFGRLKQEIDTSMMTARQRAMLGHEIQGENELVELPTVRKKDENSEEAVKRRKQRAKKRKQQMEKQIEENKAQTIERLLKKQVKSRKEVEKQKRIQKADVPRVMYLNNKNGISISFPVDMDVPFKRGVPRSPTSEPVMCAAHGCGNAKRYSCSQTKLPLCSLGCYKKIQQTTTVAMSVA